MRQHQLQHEFHLAYVIDPPSTPDFNLQRKSFQIFMMMIFLIVNHNDNIFLGLVQ